MHSAFLVWFTYIVWFVDYKFIIIQELCLSCTHLQVDAAKFSHYLKKKTVNLWESKYHILYNSIILLLWHYFFVWELNMAALQYHNINLEISLLGDGRLWLLWAAFIIEHKKLCIIVCVYVCMWMYPYYVRCTKINVQY